MSRVKRGTKRRQRLKKVFDRTEGFFLGRKNLYTRAKEQADRSYLKAYEGRKQRKRNFRRLWNTRISAAVEPHGLSYSRFIGSLKDAKIQLNRKMLADLAVRDPKGFEHLVQNVESQASKG